MTEAALALQEVTKDFPGVRALDAASLSVRPGEVHGLVGENGAGKSTIIKVLAGVYPPNGGRVEIFGRRIAPITPQGVHDAGIRFIHQELHLVPHFTVAESVFLGQEIGGRFGLDAAEMRRRTEAFLHDTLACDIAANALIRDLGTAERKLVQIARALIDDQARLVVFDEPTAPLASDEVSTLMTAIARLKARGSPSFTSRITSARSPISATGSRCFATAATWRCSTMWNRQAAPS
ncbi:MAG: sugar ABC transporter ATP-binding protein [Rhodobacteraceae bacterium]|nr:sugar ABC transporter ATP-binding protein [Paracoccaceae bacterium]